MNVDAGCWMGGEKKFRGMLDGSKISSNAANTERTKHALPAESRFIVIRDEISLKIPQILNRDAISHL